MSTEKTITVKAADGTLTIAELRAFLDEFDMTGGHAPDLCASEASGLKPKARVSFGGGIKSVTVTVPGGPAAT